MAKFAIVRADGATDLVEGVSVDDVSNRFGWPGNGDIQPYDPANYPDIRHIFASPDEQRDALADKPASKGKASKDDEKGDDVSPFKEGK